MSPHRKQNSLCRLLIMLLVVSSVAMTAGEAVSDTQGFKDFATELLKKGDPEDVKNWDGKSVDRGIYHDLRRVGPAGWEEYVKVGVASAARYSVKDHRLGQYWKPFVGVLSLPDMTGGRALLNRVLQRDDVPQRIKTWIAYYLLEKANFGRALSWLDSEALLAVCRVGLVEPILVVSTEYMVFLPLDLPLKPGGNRPRARYPILVIDSQRLAARVLQELFFLPTGYPKDSQLWGTPAELPAWTAAIEASRRMLPIAEARAVLATKAEFLIDQRALVRMGPEQIRALVRSRSIDRRADGASLLQNVTWALALREVGDELGQVASQELLSIVDRGLRAGSYLPNYPGIVEVGDEKSPLARLAKLAPPTDADFRDPVRMRAWLKPYLLLYGDLAGLYPASGGTKEWTWALKELGIEAEVGR